MLEAILQAPFSEVLTEIEPGNWIPLVVHVLRDISEMILDLIYGYSNRLKRLLIIRNRKGEKRRASVEFLKSLFKYNHRNNFE